MHDPARLPDDLEDFEELKEQIAPRWTGERERRVWHGVERRSRARGRWGLALVGALALTVVAMFLLRAPSPSPVVERPADRAPTLRLADGTEVASLTPDARVEAVEAEAGVTALRLVTGAARFDVAHVEGRVFQVLAGDTVVEVLGTRFVVKLEGKGTHVSVERGQVRVSWPGGERDLVRGESVSTGDVGRAAAPQIASDEEEPAARTPPASEPGSAEVAPPTPRAPAAAASWQRLARAGRYDEALERLSDSSRDVADDPAELLLAADVARLGGAPARAVPWLRRVVDGHSSDARAPLAAFTLGRVLLDQLGRPGEAARAFARARTLAPAGAMAEDALAREVESLARAGDTARAQQRARQYLKTYPDGRRREAVRRHAAGP